ncbi:MAG: TetR/AcrR family transcriptional regulator [Oscillospiraceae bacterium]|nr:TetR/AcrR family transcriptional regulator [Oscillospiraceae bacterium]MBP1553120.1 TetR/AcrR family transcriptional regulator [Oscillospiraceae bacterium]MBP1570465.1 TetR/AcrR family transcriptional regulator [Oscillospiraceae bacterium]MBQ5313815.1 TetR/AcrR family transcriptional regulator [Oscillospiraceae bacterium]MBQ5324201.1 TetR/AcrR family transcriptional regulator [Oscillospiraceae bacterium]
MARMNTTKAKITKVAWQLFHEKGYSETTIDDIIAASGTSKGSFYHYYSSKDELLSSLSEVFDAKYEEVMQTLDKDMNSYEKLLYLCYTVHDMIEKEIPIGLLASLYSSQVVTKGDKHLQNQDRYYYYVIRQIIDEGQKRGQIATDLTVREIQQLYTLAERAIIYDYCISNGNYSLGEYTRKIMPRLISTIKV